MARAAVALIWIVVVVAIFLTTSRLYARTRWSLLHPTLLTILGTMALVRLVGGGAPFGPAGRALGALLGPAVVALGVPLGLRWDEVARERRALLAAIGAGSVAAILAAAGTAMLLGAPALIVRSLVPRSVTTPIAVEVARAVGGLPALAAAVSIGSGVLGAVIGPPLLRRLGVTRADSWGLAMGAAAHGIGTARAAEEGEPQAAAAGLAIALMGLATAALAGLGVWLLG